MDYLTVKEVAELKGCSERYIRKLIGNGYIFSESIINNSNGHICHSIPISALSEDLQAKYYARLKKETGLAPELKEEKEPLKKRLKGSEKAFEEYSEAERQEIAEWCDILREWQELRANYKKKTDFDSDFVGKCRIEHPNIQISESILYRKYKAYLENDYNSLIDKRGGWNRDKSKLDDDSIIWQSFLNLYLDQSKPSVSLCYRLTNAVISHEHPELADLIPSEACFRRKIKTLPFAVLEYSREGDKALNDHCKPHANRDKDNIYANDVWIMDNYTLDVIIKDAENSKKTRRLYITTVLDAKSNVLVGWNITENPDSNSTLDALRFAMLRFGIPKNLYFDNGREFTTLDIAGEQRNRKVSKDKKGNIPLTIAEKLGVNLTFAKVTNARAKVVERIHRIIKEQYCTAQYGYCGGNVVERPEIIKSRIKNGNIETEAELRETFADFADNIYNVQPYGSSETKYKGMTLIEVWNDSIAETSLRKASKEVLDLLMLRNAGFQKVKRDGVFIPYHGEKIWYYDKNVTWQHIGEKVCVRYDRNDLSSVRIYDEEDRYLYSWECADWLTTNYFNEDKEKLAELGRGQADVVKQIKMRSKELRGDITLTQKEGMKHLSKQNEGKFRIIMPKNIIPVTTSEPMPKVANGENIQVPINLKTIMKNAKKQKGDF